MWTESTPPTDHSRQGGIKANLSSVASRGTGSGDGAQGTAVGVTCINRGDHTMSAL